MKIQIKNKNQEVLFETDNVGKAYSYLKSVAPENQLCTFKNFKRSIAEDIEFEFNNQRYQFVLNLNDDQTDCVYMDVDYENLEDKL